MTKKHFIELADCIRTANFHGHQGMDVTFTSAHLKVLASFCRSQNGRFLEDRWLSYIAGKCGPNGGDS